ncbi:MAG: hypothetical protein M1837_005103 [Sclerophora amabilis]|nr:MAG: hypothetical protein M1837_005103 [Sclerophora amabilis]
MKRHTAHAAFNADCRVPGALQPAYSIYRTVEDQGVELELPDETLSPKEISNSRLEKRLKQVERSLQSLQRQLRPELISKKPRKRPRTEVEEDGETRLDGTSASTSSSSEPMSRENQHDGFEIEAQANEDGESSLNASNDENLGFMGPSSHVAVLHDLVSTQKQFKNVLTTLKTATSPSPMTDPSWSMKFGESRFFQPRLTLGVQVLRSLPPKSLCDELMNVFFSVFDPIRPVIPRPWAYKVYNALFAMPGLEDPTGHSDMSVTVSLIESKQYEGVHFLGQNPYVPVKWNLIGMLFAKFAVAALTSTSHDSILLAQQQQELHGEGPHAFARRMLDNVGICWRLSNTLETVDEASVLLLYLYIVVHTLLGEFGPFVWHLHGCLISAVTSVGLHRKSSESEPNHFLRTQRRGTEYAAIYALDKTLSTFTGRPPLLLRRFSNIPLPLDITHEDLMLPDAEREVVTRKLDPDGWDPDGRVCPATFSRAQMLVALAREDVLELTLTFPKNVDSTTILSLQRRILDQYGSVPFALRYHDDIASADSTRCLYIQKTVLYLFSLESSFLLHNTASKSQATRSLALLKVSLRLLDTIVDFWKHRGQFGHYLYPLSWLLTAYAFPSAGVISSHLLQLHKKANEPGSASPQSVPSKQDFLPKLALFLEALTSIQPDDPHFRFCQKAHRIFSRTWEILSGKIDSSAGAATTASKPSQEPPYPHADQTSLAPNDHQATPVSNDVVSPNAYSTWMIDQEWADFQSSFPFGFDLPDDVFMNAL